MNAITAEALQAPPGAALPALTPSQTRTFDAARNALAGGHAILINGGPGSGKTLVLRHLQALTGGRLLTAADGMRVLADRPADAMEEALVDLLKDAYSDNEVVLFDDFTLFDQIGFDFAERPWYLPQVFGAVYDDLARTGRKLIATSAASFTSDLNKAQAVVIELDPLAAEDYVAIIGNQMGTDVSDFDVDKLTRTFRKLSAYHIEAVTNTLRAEGKTKVTADDFIEKMGSFVTNSNVDMDEVEQVSLDGLVGVDEIVRDLRRTVLLPMTEPELARELGLTPKRGVLLYGDPGTGKTTIGRALAQAMKGKFFMIDGTFIPGTTDFNDKVNAVLAAAEASSPSVVFIDDADVIFRGGQQPGFARKLLTKLDGLESATQGNVCIVMTAMDVSDLPPALLRSGRVEVWLETKLPDPAKRAGIIRYYSTSLPKDQTFDIDDIVAITDGFTPADLRGLVGDARAHLAYDRHRGRPAKTFTEYLKLAAAEIAERKKTLRRLMPRAA